MPDFTRRKIGNSKSVGEVLKAVRKKKEISLEDAELEIKVRAKYLEALEDGRYDILPGGVYTQGFLLKYADFLGLDKERILTQFKAEVGASQHLAKLMPERKIKEPLFSITPRLVAIGVVFLVIFAILGYIVFSVRQITTPPNLLISSPSEDTIIKESKVEIIGKTDEGSTLEINNQAVLLDDRGNFNQQVKLNPGLNTFEIKATNRLKKETTKKLQILAEY